MADFLYDDVWYHILGFCSTSTLREFSLVSSSSRVLALPYLLYHVSISKSPDQLMAFLNYMILERNSPRDDKQPALRVDMSPGKYVHRLDVVHLAFHPTELVCNGHGEDIHLAFAKEDVYPPGIWAPMLTRALVLMENIRVIEIDDCLEDILINSPEFALTLFNRPHLVRVGLGCVGLVAMKLFGQAIDFIKEPLQLEKMQFHRVDHVEVLELIKSEGMGSVLLHVRNQLTELSVNGADFRLLLEPRDNDGITGALIFPNVTILSLRGCYISSESLARSFPSLSDLTLGFELVPPPDNPGLSHLCRFCNLISVKGLYRDLRAFLKVSAHPRLRRVIVESVWTNDDNGPFSVTRTVPLLKSFHFKQRENKPLTWWKDLSATLKHLTYLSISLPGRNTEDLHFVLNSIPGALHSFPVTYISFTLCVTSLQVGDRESPEARHQLVDYAIARSFGENIPTLKYIDVCKEVDVVRGPSTWWKVLRVESFDDDSTVAVKALSPSEGQDLRDWYDLEAS